METKKTMVSILYAIALALAVAALVFSYTGLPGTFDSEPLLAIGLLFVAFAGISGITKNK